MFPPSGCQRTSAERGLLQRLFPAFPTAAIFTITPANPVVPESIQLTLNAGIDRARSLDRAFQRYIRRRAHEYDNANSCRCDAGELE